MTEISISRCRVHPSLGIWMTCEHLDMYQQRSSMLLSWEAHVARELIHHMHAI
jgi:hypothetical protein